MDEKTFRAMRRAARRRAGLCTICGRDDERTKSGRARCAVCAEKDRQRAARRMQNPGIKEKYNASVRQRHAERKAQGLCPICGKPTADGYVQCAVCREKFRKWYSNSGTKEGDPK